MSRPLFRHAVKLALTVAVILATAVGVAHAKPWAKLVRETTGSDSTYAAFSARPMDSLSTDEAAWADVQRDWRWQRDQEKRSSSSITEAWRPRRVRPTDERFAELASRSFTALTAGDRDWLVTESSAQRADRVAADRAAAAAGSQVAGVLLVAVAAGALAAYLTVYAIFHGVGN